MHVAKIIRCILATCLWAMLSAQAQNLAPSAAHLPSLFASSQVLALAEPVRYLVTPHEENTSADKLAALPAHQWVLLTQSGALPTNKGQDVWLRLVLPVASTPQTWMLRIPRQSLQKATLYARSDTQRTWQTQSAGHDVAHQDWPLRSRDPVFELSTRPDQTQLFLVRLEHRMAITESIQLIQSGDFANGTNLVGQLQGLIIGLFGLLTVISVVSAYVHRNQHFAWFALFVFSVLFAHLTVTGYLMVRVWPQSVYLTQTMAWVAPLLSLAALAGFALSVSYAKQLSPPIYYAMWGVVGMSVLLSVMVMMRPDSYARDPLNAWYAIGMFTVVSALSWIAWRSQRWLWLVVVSLLPICLSVIVRLAYNLGWFVHVEQAMLAAVITTSVGLVVTYSALVLHQRERLSALQQHSALETRDAATGLFNERIAQVRLPQIILRSKRFGQPCGAIMVRWLDMNCIMQDKSITERGRIFAHLGNRLGRLARDIDTAARMGDDLFVYLVEAPVSREQLNELASHVLTTCMRPSQVMPNQKGFDLHLAIWLSSETEADSSQAFELLKTRLDQMRDGTQRRVQFVDTNLSTGSGIDRTSAESSQQLVEKINALEATQGLPRIVLPERKTAQNQSSPGENPE